MGMPRLVKLLSAAAVGLLLYANSGALYSPPPRFTPQAVPVSSAYLAEAVLRDPQVPGTSTPLPPDAARAVRSLRLKLEPPPPSVVTASSLPQQCVPNADSQRRDMLNLVAEDGVEGCGAEGRGGICAAVAQILSHKAARKQIGTRMVLITSAVAGQEDLLSTFLEASGALRLPTLVLNPSDEPAPPSIESESVAVAAVRVEAGVTIQRKWESIERVLSAGVGVFYADVDAILASDPLELLYRDSDVEGLSQAWEESDARGFVMGSDDPSMGWSRYCESMRVAHLDPSLLYLSPTGPAAALARRMAALATEGGWDRAEGAAWARGPEESVALSEEVFSPSHDGYTRVGVSSRVMAINCWLNSLTSVHRLPDLVAQGERVAVAFPGGRGGGGVGRDGGGRKAEALEDVAKRQQAAVRHFHGGAGLGWAWRHKSQIPPRGSLERTRMDPLMFIPRQVNRTKELVLRNKCKREPVARNDRMDSTRPLRLIVKPDEEWPVNCADQPELCETVKRVAIDRAVMAAVSNRNILHMLGQFVDVVQKNPFVALYRDSDVEGMSDGWDDLTAYGHIHSLPVLDTTLTSLRIVARNSGLFYLSATHQSVRLMKLLAETMASVDVWDQSAFNMEIFRPAYAGKVTAGVSVRVMNYLCFVNTKLLFKYMRYDPQLGVSSLHRPVTVHMNYHPEKELRMADVNRFYHLNDQTALEKWNGGEGRSTGSCKGKLGVNTERLPSLQPDELSSHTLVKNLLARSEGWVWPGHGTIRFDPSGELRSDEPGVSGASWGTVPSVWRKDSLHVKMGSQTYLLMFLSEKWVFVALRCEDEQVTYGRLDAASVPERRLVF